MVEEVVLVMHSEKASTWPVKVDRASWLFCACVCKAFV